MAKTRELRRRIRSIEKTRQITKTLEMVATSKLKRSTDRVHAARPYAERLAQVIGRLLDPELRERYPLLRQPRQVRRAAILLLTSDRGMAGAFNVNLIREARALIERLEGEGVGVELHAVGRKGISFFRFSGRPLASARTDVGDRPSAEDAAALIEPLVSRFESREVDAVYVVHAQFRSAMSTPPGVVRVLPVAEPEGGKGGGAVQNLILSPSADEILNRLLPLYVRNAIYRALVETVAGFYGAQRTAMKSATDNAGDIIDALRRQYNRLRQGQITQEIAEIVGGAAALE